MDFLKELIIGVKKYLDSGRKYPYPDSLMNSMNMLCLEMPSGFPKTMTGFLKLLGKSVKNWCPKHLIPVDYDENQSLIKVQEGKIPLLKIELTESAKNYLG
jgi:hypothetical protein